MRLRDENARGQEIHNSNDMGKSRPHIEWFQMSIKQRAKVQAQKCKKIVTPFVLRHQSKCQYLKAEFTSFQYVLPFLKQKNFIFSAVLMILGPFK